MNFDFNTINIVRMAIYLVVAVAAFVVLVKILKFFAGMTLGFVVTLVLAYLYYKNC